MEKLQGKIAFLLALTALLSATAGVCLMENPQGERMLAHAETLASQPQGDTLISPSSYEQFLPLQAPSDVAVTDDYIAISDGSSVFVYDKKDGIYRQYVHTENADAPKNVITKLQFDELGNLYFLDSSTTLYFLDVTLLETETSPRPTRTNLMCSTFAIHGEYLYFSSVTGSSQISKTLLANPDVATAKTLVTSLYSDPKIAFWNGELYYNDADLYLNKLDPEEETPVPVLVYKFQSGIRSMNISEGIFSYSDADDNFYAYGLADLLSHNAQAQPIAEDHGGYKAVSAYGEYLYTVKKHSVRRFSLKDVAFDDYEICNRSNAENRLDGATQTCLVDDLLLIADNGNDRLSVYDVENGLFQTPIPLTFDPTHLASDGETVLVSNEEVAILYDLSTENYGAQLLSFADFNGTVIGSANVYGAYYFATENNFYYRLEETQTDETFSWVWTESKKTTTRYADLLCSDAYGYLYVASGNKVFRYTEEEFLETTKEGEELCNSLPAATKQLLVDYEGSMYALNGTSVQKITKTSTENFDLSISSLYNATATPLSIAFGVEENQTYILYAENYLVQTPKFSLPTVKTIQTENAGADIFAEESATVSVVRTQPDTLLVEFDLQTLKDADVFPYVGYERRRAPFTALKIGETQKHAILAVYDQAERKYFTYLALHSSCEELSDDEFRKPYKNPKTGHLTNDVTLYKFPYLTALLPVTDLPRGAELTLLGEINQLDHPYYHASYTDEQGTTHTGYIPMAYVTLFNGEPPTATSQTLGATKSNTDAVWRLTYLILGTAAICILVDILLLREPDKKQDEEE